MLSTELASLSVGSFHKKEEKLTHLFEIKQAIIVFQSALQPRIEDFNHRKELSFFKRFSSRLKTGYGETGFQRTKLFIEAMTDEKIETTQDLIHLTMQKQYIAKGSILPHLLKKATLTICSFEAGHIHFLMEEKRKPIMKDAFLHRRPDLRQRVLDNLGVRVVSEIYDIITTTHDYGKTYLDELNSKLELAKTAKYVP